MAYGVALSAWSAAHGAVGDLIFTGSDVAKVVIMTSSLVTLAEITLSYYDSYVDQLTGVLHLEVLDQEDSAQATGTAAYAEIFSADGSRIMSMNCTQGTIAVAGQCVLDIVAINIGTPVEMQSIIIQPTAVLAS